MVLDSEEQRKALLTLIEIAPVQGMISQVRETVKALDRLKSAVLIAAIAETQTQNEKENEQCLPNASELSKAPAR